MLPRFAIVSSVISALLLSACATPMGRPAAGADLLARSGSTVSGKVSFSEANGRLRVTARVAGLTPGEHGFHLHESGDCSAADASSAKGHFNPTGQAHGDHAAAVHHGGDMPNLVAGADGVAIYDVELSGLTLDGPTGVLGRSVVVHADADDFRSQPAGNSGKRIACGTIVAN